MEENIKDKVGDNEEKIENQIENNDETIEEKESKKKIKNLISLIILLSGLFIGSLFVDIAQLTKGSGYSQKNLNKSDIFEANGKTWVAYDNPVVSVKVLSDESCQSCDPSEVLVWLRRVLPTISFEKIELESSEGKNLVSDFDLKALPAFVFDEKVSETELYLQASMIFEPKNESFVLNIQELGVPVGKYLELPKADENTAFFGKENADLKIFVFSDFQCPYSKIFHTALRDTMEEYKEKVAFYFKEFPLIEIHPQANEASLAAECALEQNKFWEYADKLFEKQAEWGDAKNNFIFKTYAKNLKLDSNQFNKCLDEKKYQNKIDNDKNEAFNFGITGTPTIFIGDRVESGVLSSEELKNIIEEKLK